MLNTSLAWMPAAAFMAVAATTCFAQPGPVTLTANPPQMTFHMQPGMFTPSQTLTITSSPGPVDIKIIASSKGNWLVAAPGGAATPASIVVSVGAGGPSSGTDIGSITISGGGTTISVNVVLIVIAAPTGPAFVVTGPITSPISLTANTGVTSVSFAVGAKSGSQSSISGVAFQASSSNGVLSLSSSSDCSETAPVILSSTSSTSLFACIDTQKVVAGRYVFLLTVRSPRLGGVAGGNPSLATEPAPASAADICAGLVAAMYQPTRVKVDVTVVGTSGGPTPIQTSPSDLTLYSDSLSDFFFIKYQGSAGSAAVNGLTTDPISPDEGAWITVDFGGCPGISVDPLTSCKVTVAANPFKLLGAVVGQTYTSALPIGDTKGSGAEVAVNFTYSQAVASQLFPQFADGDDWQTDFTLSNGTTATACADLVFHFESSTQVVPIMDVGTVNSVKNIVIPPLGTVVIHTTGLKTNPLVYGWAEIVSSVHINGNARFQRHPTNGTYSDASVPAIVPSARFSLPFDSTVFVDATNPNGIDRVTGIAIVNPHSVNTVNVSCSIFVPTTVSGLFTQTVVYSRTLGPYAHAQATFNGSDPGSLVNLHGSSGTLFCTSLTTPQGIPQPVGAIALLFLSDRALNSLPVIPN